VTLPYRPRSSKLQDLRFAHLLFDGETVPDLGSRRHKVLLLDVAYLSARRALQVDFQGWQLDREKRRRRQLVYEEGAGARLAGEARAATSSRAQKPKVTSENPTAQMPGTMSMFDERRRRLATPEKYASRGLLGEGDDRRRVGAAVACEVLVDLQAPGSSWLVHAAIQPSGLDGARVAQRSATRIGATASDPRGRAGSCRRRARPWRRPSRRGAVNAPRRGAPERPPGARSRGRPLPRRRRRSRGPGARPLRGSPTSSRPGAPGRAAPAPRRASRR
jgi:hypothetical protein